MKPPRSKIYCHLALTEAYFKVLKDISNRADIEFLLKTFYKALLSDTTINHFFQPLEESGQLDEHLSTIADFWHDVLFLSATYKKNVMKVHGELHKQHKISAAHFTTWLHYFNKTVDQNFSGENAILAKTRAQSIATIMQIKLRDL